MRPNPVSELKRQLGELLAREIAGRRRWEIAAFLGIDAARISNLRHGQLERFSLEKLIEYADRLGYHVELTIKRRRLDEGRNRRRNGVRAP